MPFIRVKNYELKAINLVNDGKEDIETSLKVEIVAKSKRATAREELTEILQEIARLTIEKSNSNENYKKEI